MKNILNDFVIIIDFDGTIVDCWYRYYKVFTDILGRSIMSFDRYKYLRKKGISDKEIIKNHVNEIVFDNKAKRILLELPEYLRFDTLLISSKKLFRFYKKFNTIILTKRQSSISLYWQIEKLGIKFIKPNIRLLNDEITKKEYIMTYYSKNNRIYIIGDSDAEAEISDLQNSQVYIVGTGFGLTRKYNANNIIFVNNINNAIRIIEKDIYYRSL